MKQIVFALSFVLISSAYAKQFANKYIQFELPSGWECVLEGSEWVCQSNRDEVKKEAIIIMAAKIRGPQDSLDQYQAYLKKTKTFTLPGGKTQVSDPKTAEMKEISGHRWVDALHLASEVPGFYTRYLATVKEDLGVAVTFSVVKDQYTNYQGLFDRVVATMKVFRQAAATTAMATQKSESYDFDDAEIDVGDAGIDLGANRGKGPAKKSSGGDDSTLLYAGLGVLLVFFLLKKMRSK